MYRRRLQRSRIGAWSAAALAALLGGCATLGSGPERRLDAESAAAPEVLAWTLGAMCRAVHPGVDPWPGSDHAPLPMLREPDGALVVAIGGTPEGPLRIASNGRLARPSRSLDDDAGVRLSPGTFVPSDRCTGHRGHRAIEIRVTPTAGGGSHVSIVLDDTPSHGPLFERLTATVATLDALLRGSACLAARQNSEADRVATNALVRLRDGETTGLGELEAGLHVERAIVALRAGDLLSARLRLSSAASLVPGDGEVIARLAQLDQRLARTTDADRSLRLLAAGIGDPGRANDATQELAHASRIARWTPPAEHAAATAVRLLAAGDTTAGLSWARSARVLGGDSTRAGCLDAHARARGDHRSAFVVGLARLDRIGFDRDLVVALCADALAADDAPAALRVLAAHWDEMQVADPDAADSLFDSAVANAGPSLAARVLSSARSPALASRALDAWDERSGSSVAAATDLLERLPALRAKHPAITPSVPPQGDWRQAPGVAPMR